MADQRPLVSIILTTYNCDTTLEKTLLAIEKQSYPDIEIVIKDGCSSDHTLEIIQWFEGVSTRSVKWISKSDGGIYDAMNQGYAMSNGEIIVFCSDLFISSDAISMMVKAILRGGKDCIGGHADLVYAEGDEIKRYWRMGKGTIRDGWMPGHPTLFLKRSVYEKYGLYRDDYRIAADYEFMIRVLNGQENKLVYVPETIVSMYYGGTSTSSISSYLDSLIEAIRALKENKMRFPLLITMKRTIKLMKQFVNS